MPDIRQEQPSGLFAAPDVGTAHPDAPQRRETALAGNLARASTPHNGTATSIDAAKRASGRAAEQRSVIFHLIALAGSAGMTRAEIMSASGLAENSVNPRVWELVKAGRVVGFGRRDDREVLVVAGGGAA